MNIEPFGKEYIKKITLFGVDISIGWARYCEVSAPSKQVEPLGRTITWSSKTYRRVLFLSDKYEADGIITTRYICYKLKLEFKTTVWYDGVLV